MTPERNPDLLPHVYDWHGKQERRFFKKDKPRAMRHRAIADALKHEIMGNGSVAEVKWATAIRVRKDGILWPDGKFQKAA